MKINFNKQSIKLLQLTDCHLSYPFTEENLQSIQRVINYEVPDLIVITGDLFHHEHNHQDSVTLVDEFIKFFEQFKTPYSYCFGNHDGELSMKTIDIYRTFQNKSNYFIGQIGEDDVTTYHPNDSNDKTPRIGNFGLDINLMNENNCKLIMLDSGRYSDSKGYGSLTSNQVKYVKRELDNYKRDVYIFFHIPLEEHRDLYEHHLIDGTRRENDCPQTENSMLFDYLVSLNNDIYVYCGHDHLNDYSVKTSNVTLGITPGFCTEQYNDETTRGYRIFEMGTTNSNKVKRLQDIK